MKKQRYSSTKLWVIGIGVGVELTLLTVHLIISGTLLKILLWPYVMVCEWFYPLQFEYEMGIGYRCIQVPVVISKSCLGNGFMAMLFGLIFFCFIKELNQERWGKWLVISSCLTVILGYLMNSIRILASVSLVGFNHFELIHLTIGIVLYLGSLIGINALLKGYFARGNRDEKVN